MQKIIDLESGKELNTYYEYGELSTVTNKILSKLGIDEDVKGYKYLKEAVILAVCDKEIINFAAKELYPTVAYKFETTPARVERNIRHTIELVWDKYSYRPTNREFISAVSDKIKMYIML